LMIVSRTFSATSTTHVTKARLIYTQKGNTVCIWIQGYHHHCDTHTAATSVETTITWLHNTQIIRELTVDPPTKKSVIVTPHFTSYIWPCLQLV
jgi:hypothetical protein